jgi:hypothetical protein
MIRTQTICIHLPNLSNQKTPAAATGEQIAGGGGRLNLNIFAQYTHNLGEL